MSSLPRFGTFCSILAGGTGRRADRVDRATPGQSASARQPVLRPDEAITFGEAASFAGTLAIKRRQRSARWLSLSRRRLIASATQCESRGISGG